MDLLPKYSNRIGIGIIIKDIPIPKKGENGREKKMSHQYQVILRSSGQIPLDLQDLE